MAGDDPDILPRKDLRAAAVLGSVSVNIGRAVGPAIAGLIIGFAGVAPVFGLNAASLVVFVGVLLWVRVPHERDALGRERFIPALRAGRSYVRWSPYTRSVLVRAALFLLPAMAIWALLPIVATQHLGLDAPGYGVLLASLGIGAVVGVAVLGRIRRRLSDDALLKVASVVYAAAMALLIAVPSVPVAIAVLVVAGGAWLAVLSTVNALLQLFLPGWVRARGLAIYIVVLYGAQAIGAVVWGLIADFGTLGIAFIGAAALMLIGVLVGLRWPLRDVSGIDRTSVTPWPEARLALNRSPTLARSSSRPTMSLLTTTPTNSWRRWNAWVWRANERAQRPGLCTATDQIRLASWRFSKFQPGTSTCASTADG